MRERKNMSDESNSGDVNEEDLLLVPNNCAESVKNFSKYVWESISHHELPNWLKDNEFIEHGHRPELPSITACLKSWFRLHTETGNIWTHLFGIKKIFCLNCIFRLLNSNFRSFNVYIHCNFYIFNTNQGKTFTREVHFWNFLFWCYNLSVLLYFLPYIQLLLFKSLCCF